MPTPNPLAPYRPDIDGPWTRLEAAHLLRRAGFRADEDELQQTLDAGVAKSANRLTRAQPEGARYSELDPLGERLAPADDIDRLAGWWLAKMVHTANPLAARLSVFWHNHFATSFAKVRSGPMMLAQLRTFEQHALGNFADMVVAVARDPAMIVWLDGDSNNKGRPNENFARELLELFTLGVGQYTEADIKETARAFTGWHQRRGVFSMARADHDDSEKTILQSSGRFDGADVVPILLKQPAAATFLARKLAREFVTDTPDDALIDALASVLRDTKFDMRETMHALLSSRALFAAYRARISAPVEFVVGAARALTMRLDMTAAARAAGEMGQRLFQPPSVKGWDGGRAWINSATMLVRMNGAAAACAGGENGVGLDAAAFLRKYNLSGARDAADFLCRLLLDGRTPDALRAMIDRVADSARTLNDKVRIMAQAILGSPEYQVV